MATLGGPRLQRSTNFSASSLASAAESAYSCASPFLVLEALLPVRPFHGCLRRRAFLHF